MQIQNKLEQQIQIKNEIEQINLEDLIELAFMTLTELIKLQRSIGFWLIGQNKASEKHKHRIYLLLRDIADNTHNIPYAIKKSDKHSLAFELSLVANMLSNIETQKRFEEVSIFSSKHLLLEFKEYGIELPLLK